MLQAKINFITREKIVKEYQTGASAISLGQKYGCDAASVYRYLRAARVEVRTLQFDCELADKLRKEYEAGANTTQLAAKYKTTKQRIARYIREAGGTIRNRGPVPSS